MGGNQARKIRRQLESARLVKCPVQRAEKLALGAKFLSTTRAGFQMALENFKCRTVQLDVKISGDIVAATLMVCRESVHEIPAYAELCPCHIHHSQLPARLGTPVPLDTDLN